MKRTILPILLLISILKPAQAQFMEAGNRFMNLSYSYTNDKAPNKFKTLHVRTQTEWVEDLKKGKSYLSRIDSVNENGMIYLGYHFNKKGKLTEGWFINYSDSIHYKSFYSFSKKDTSSYLYTFNDSNHITQLLHYQSNKLIAAENYTYNNIGKKDEMQHFGKNNQLKFHYKYSYYDNGSIKEARLYNGKGKLKQVWSYACTPSGELEKQVKQTNYCKVRNYNPDSSYFEINEGTDNKGKTQRTVKKFSKDSLMLEFQTFGNNGKEIHKTQYTYNQKREKIGYTTYYKGKLRYKNVLALYQNGLQESSQYFDKKGLSGYKTHFTYTYY
jgi:hypothetical protein